jgi:2-isopropylmalate synthase
MTDRIIIFDTTLRDGEQSPGATMTAAEKLEVAAALSRLGVDVIEAGFPAASLDDLEAVRRIAQAVGNAPRRSDPALPPPVICGLARASRADIDRAWEGVKSAARPRIHTFIATSELHMKYKLKLNRAQVLARVTEAVGYARALCADVEFSPEDAGRSEPEYLHEVLAAAIKAGATTLNIPDTVGYTLPDEFGALIANIRKNTPGIERCVISVHCHDDLGLAVANSLAGLRAGARQAEVTVNGIGERAGNASLEELVMTLATRRSALELETGVDTTQLARASRLVSRFTGFAVAPNKAVVGANAFAHESGIHQDGMLKHRQTYEIMTPESVGVEQTRLVLGKHSGRRALTARLAKLGYAVQALDLDRFFSRFKALAERKKMVTDGDLDALMGDESAAPPEYYSLDGLQVTCGTIGLPTATVRLRGPGGALHVQAALGAGPVDACFKAVDAVLGVPSTLREYTVQSVTEGIDALGSVSLRVEPEAGAGVLDAQSETEHPRSFGGAGSDTDIVVASVRAYLAALNKLLAAQAGESADRAAGASVA